jgi:hypothetical protein
MISLGEDVVSFLVSFFSNPSLPEEDVYAFLAPQIRGGDGNNSGSIFPSPTPWRHARWRKGVPFSW